MEETKPWYSRWWAIGLGLVGTMILVMLIAFVFYVLDVKNKLQSGELKPPADAAIDTTKKYDAESDRNYWFGAANPKVTIVEFSDFACPFCEKSFSTIREISLKYKDTVKLEYRYYPVKQDYSVDLALAAHCAGEQGLFWLMHDKLFQHQSVASTAELNELAKAIGADTSRFAACLSSKKYLPIIQKDVADAQAFGIKGTPTWFVNGYKIEGDLPLSAWKEIINKFTK